MGPYFPPLFLLLLSLWSLPAERPCNKQPLTVLAASKAGDTNGEKIPRSSTSIARKLAPKGPCCSCKAARFPGRCRPHQESVWRIIFNSQVVKRPTRKGRATWKLGAVNFLFLCYSSER